MITIGITAPVQNIEYSPGFPQQAVVARKDYCDKIAPNAVVYILPAVREVAENPDEYLRNLDALVVTGGSDIDPENYGAERSPHTGAPDGERDAAERALVAAAKRKRMPVLGICRGMQMLNVFQGGDLHQHLPDVVHTDIHQKSATGFSLHRVTLHEGSALAEFSGSTEFQVHTFHHQGVSGVGGGLRVVARAEDGVAEALETEGARSASPGKWPAMGVQWHPEAGSEPTDFAPFRWLARKAAAYRARKHSSSPAPVRSSLAQSGLTGRSAKRARGRRRPAGTARRTAKR
ncbi:gamma-glutamyl-gamma-aminobutyrate hydrolase family protein [Nocardiopsis coralliicola]